MDYNCFSYEQEAYDRNHILNQIHGKIPSYALWSYVDLMETSIKSRLAWWDDKSFDSEHKVADRWRLYLTNKLKPDLIL